MASKNGTVKAIHRLRRYLSFLQGVFYLCNLWMALVYFSSSLRPALRLSQFMIALKIRK
jgi:hypothetical protein